jgi:hypothetical protein
VTVNANVNGINTRTMTTSSAGDVGW